MDATSETIIHVIDTLSIGGCETLLVNTINALPQFNHVVVYLNPPTALAYRIPQATLYCLDFNSKATVFKAIFKLRTIIKKHKAKIVHSHLFWSTFISRMAVSNKVLLVSTHHNDSYFNHRYPNTWVLILLDRLTYRRQFVTLAVSQYVHDGLVKLFPRRPIKVLYNFIEESYFKATKKQTFYQSGPLRLVAVGTFRLEKNYFYLAEAFAAMKELPVTLDIYGGNGNLRQSFEEFLIENGIKSIRIMGTTDELSSILVEYDLFVMASQNEGLGLALVEAMALNMPVFVSDIPVFREVAELNALYFNPTITNDFIEKIKKIISNQIDLKSLADGAGHAAHKFSKSIYVANLLKVYDRDTN